MVHDPLQCAELKKSTMITKDATYCLQALDLHAIMVRCAINSNMTSFVFLNYGSGLLYKASAIVTYWSQKNGPLS